MCLLLIPFGFAATDDATVYYSLDDADLADVSPLDLSGNNNHGTNFGMTTGINNASCVLEQCFYNDGSAGYVSTNLTTLDTANGGVSFWFYTYTTGTNQFLVTDRTATGEYFQVVATSTGMIQFRINDGTSSTIDSNVSYTSQTLHHVVANWGSGGMELYLDNVLVGTDADTGTWSANSNMEIGRFYAGGNDLIGMIDEIGIYNHALTTGDISELYNSGAGFNPYTTDDPFSHIQVMDEYDNSTLSGLTVYQGTQSNTTDGSGIAYFFNNDGLNYTIDGGSLYFNASGTATQNATNQVSIYGALPNVSVYDVEGSQVLAFNLTSPETSNSTVDGDTELLLPPNSTTAVNASAAGWYTLEGNIATTGKDTSNKNFTGFYQTLVTINATNAFSGVPLSNFTGWIYNNETGYNTTFNDSGSGTATVNALNGFHTIYIDVDGYSLSAANFDYANYTLSTYNVTFDLYSNNSINIDIFNEETGSVVTDNVTVTITGDSSEDIYYTITGSLFVENLTDGNYSVKFDATNFTQRTYEVTVADRSTQQLNAFLSPGVDTVTFTLIDFDSSQNIEGASIIQQRLINSTWTTIESKSSDITGRAQFSYTIGVKYRFTISKTGYNTRVFELDPIIFTSYNIRLQKDLTVDKELGLFDVNIVYLPNIFYNEQNNSFSITFSSVTGVLQTYGYQLDHLSGSIGGIGSNANGQSFDTGDFLVTGAQYGDYINLTYWYDSTLGENKSYTQQFYIEGAANNQTIGYNKNYDYGMGTLEKILVAIGITLVFAGVLTLFGNALIGLAGGLLTIGIFTYMDFLSIWIVLPTFVIAVLILIGRSSQ